MPTLDRTTLDAALTGLEHRRSEIEQHITTVRRLMRASAPGRRPGRPATSEAPLQAVRPAKKRRLSAAGRRAIAEAARRRWAALKSQQTPAASAANRATKKGGISAAGRKRLAEAMKKRWAAKRTASQAAIGKKSSKKVANRATGVAKTRAVSKRASPKKIVSPTTA
jgi:hypothetical protein